MSQEIINILKPIACSSCGKRFADNPGLDAHTKAMHSSVLSVGTRTEAPRMMKVCELKESLRARGLSTSGNKDVLVRRLEGVLGDEY